MTVSSGAINTSPETPVQDCMDGCPASACLPACLSLSLSVALSSSQLPSLPPLPPPQWIQQTHWGGHMLQPIESIDASPIHMTTNRMVFFVFDGILFQLSFKSNFPMWVLA